MKEIIVVLTPGFPKDAQDTTCLTYLQNWALAMQQYQAKELYIIAFQYPFVEKNYCWKGIQVYAAGGCNTKYLSRLLTWGKVWKKLLYLKKTYKICVIQTFWLTEAAFIGEKFASMYHIPLFTTIMGQDAKVTNPYLKWLNISKHCLISDATHIKLLFPSIQQIILFGLAPNPYFTQYNAERNIDIIGIGSLIPLKRFHVFIDLIAEVKKVYPNIRSQIIGEGPEKSNLQQQIQHLHLEENVQLRGLLPYNEVLAHLHQSKLLLHTSEYEAQCLVYAEAFACGAYITCFPVGEYPIHAKAKIAQNFQEMRANILAILALPQADYTSVLSVSLADMAKAYIDLYAGQQQIK